MKSDSLMHPLHEKAFKAASELCRLCLGVPPAGYRSASWEIPDNPTNQGSCVQIGQRIVPLRWEQPSRHGWPVVHATLGKSAYHGASIRATLSLQMPPAPSNPPHSGLCSPLGLPVFNLAQWDQFPALVNHFMAT